MPWRKRRVECGLRHIAALQRYRQGRDGLLVLEKALGQKFSFCVYRLCKVGVDRAGRLGAWLGCEWRSCGHC